MDKMEQLFQISDGFNNRFGFKSPFHATTNIMEEAGEIASEVNHFERIGVKEKKHGEPDKEHLAKEAMDLMHNVLSLVSHYEVKEEFFAVLDKYHSLLKEEGHIK